MPVTPLPAAGEVFLDTRGSDRALRVSWHHLGPDEGDLVVLSLWSGDTCTGTFRLAAHDVPDLVDALRGGLARSFDGRREAARRGDGPGRELTG
jgi:hypothetical protein